MVIDNCKCGYTRYTRLDNTTPACLNFIDLECITTQQNSFQGKNVTECRKSCPLVCDTQQFDI